MILIATVFWVRLSYLDVGVSTTRGNVLVSGVPLENLAKRALSLITLSSQS